jgi:RimJ/RimL family protein N-acetyltransferase
MSETKPVLTGSEGQTFLVGETIYLRGVEEADAKTITQWYPSPFPISEEVAEERLKKEIPDQARNRSQRLIACRRGDDRPVGSLRTGTWSWMNCDISDIFADPLLNDAATIRAEMLRLVVPWLLEEREFITIVATSHGADQAVAEISREFGGRQASRLREALWQDGCRLDEIAYEFINPAWVKRLGSPSEAAEGEIEREVRQPAPAAWPVIEGDPPSRAILAGERIYLRPIEKADADTLAHWARRETETFHDDGRIIRSPISSWSWHKKLTEDDPPAWVRFALVDRKTGDMIGANGIAEIDWVHKTAETETEIVRPEYRGSGYGTEAKHLLLTYAFERLGLHMVRSYVWEFNTRSAAALRKQGYRDAGRFNWTGLKNGEFVGDFAFDLLATEWQAARR